MSDLFNECKKNNIDINNFKLLIDSGININQVDNWGSNILNYICRGNKRQNQLEIIKLLIDSGININHVNNSGENALINICCGQKRNRIEIISLLINSGININQADQYGYNAIFGIDPNINQLEIFKLFINSGIDINHINESGDNILKHILLLSQICHNRGQNRFEIIILLIKSRVNINTDIMLEFYRELLLIY